MRTTTTRLRTCEPLFDKPMVQSLLLFNFTSLKLLLAGVENSIDVYSSIVDADHRMFAGFVCVH